MRLVTWVPETEADIQKALENRLLEEGAAFEAKRELPQPGNNASIAEAICALSVNGGLLLYGITGDDASRPDQLSPIGLEGAAERVDLVAQTAIAEPIVVETISIPSAEDASLGYLAVVVPASDRSPHMVTLGGKNVYWGRGATGKRRLNEREVAELYARREVSERDQRETLIDASAACPFADAANPEGPVVTLTAVSRLLPYPGARTVARAVGNADEEEFVRALSVAAQTVDPYPDQGDRAISDAFRASRHGPDTWVLNGGSEPDDLHQVRLEAKADGALRLWQRPLAHEHRGRALLLERSVIRAICQFVGVAAHISVAAGFGGSLEVGVHLAGLRGLVGASISGPSVIARPTPYTLDSYERFATRPVRALHQERNEMVSELVAPLFSVVSLRGYQPFEDAR